MDETMDEVFLRKQPENPLKPQLISPNSLRGSFLSLVHHSRLVVYSEKLRMISNGFCGLYQQNMATYVTSTMTNLASFANKCVEFSKRTIF